MELKFKLEAFEGPLDLLLHLIEKNKVSIYDIPIAEITSQYLEYVRLMDETDMGLISGFLVMAATLLDIKAKMLLPSEKGEDGDTQEDPRSGLVQTLLEHKKYKYMSAVLADMSADSDRLICRAGAIPEEVASYRAPIDLDVFLDGVTAGRIREVFLDVIRRQADRKDPVRARFGTIRKERVQMAECMSNVRKRVRDKGAHSFRSLLEEGSSKLEIVMTFVAILELVRIGEIRLEESVDSRDFMIGKASGGGDD